MSAVARPGAAVSIDAAALRACVGADGLDGDERTWRFAAAGVRPAWVVRPRSVEAVSAVVSEVAAAGGAVIPAGNATHLDVGLPPSRYDVALSTAALDRVLTHDAADLTVTVEAGITLAALNAALLAAGQWLPLDPPRAEAMTIGGLIAADRNGPLRLAHGKVRDLLIGLKVVLADGALLKGGGRVVKNVAGYDLPKLFTGSFGTLGVIVEASFKVLPRPAQMRLFVWRAPALGEAVRRALALLDGAVFPVLLEAVNGEAGESIGLDPGAALVIGCAGSEPEISAQENCLRELAGAGVTACEPARGEALLKALRDFPQPADEDAVVARISAAPTALAGLLERIEAEAAARQSVVEIAAHAGNGVAWCQLLGASDAQGAAWLAEWMRVHVREHGAWVVFEALPAALRGRLDPWGFSGSALPLMSGVKRALDPAQLFSPGRFVGGI